MPPHLLSVCVCTFDGVDRIADTLWSLAGQSAPHESFEIVVIDNGSAEIESLRALVADFDDQPVSISLVVEDRPGLSHARNTALRQSDGEYLLFVDDDAIASPCMVERYISAIVEHQPDVIGGNVNPLFERWPGPEFDYRYWPRWSLKLFGNRDRWLAEGEYFIGTNMGARRTLLAQEEFDPKLGRCGSSLAGGEDWFLGDSRFRRRFVSGADVFHKVPVARVDTSYLARRSADQNELLQSVTEHDRSRVPPPTVTRTVGQMNPIGREIRTLFRKLRFHYRISRLRKRARLLQN
jgi:glycosyltransferase involved in cell wall biosynthesis